MLIEPIAHFHSPFKEKFGIPKQSGLVEDLRGSIIFTPEFRNDDYLRGIEQFEYLWLIWGFSANKHSAASPLVRPPLLGGNKKMGVFATRSPFRPNPIGLSSVKLLATEHSESHGTTLIIGGADLMDGTPIYDIKPYVTYADCHNNARSGFVDTNETKKLHVIIPGDIAESLDPSTIATLEQLLALDPRPHYHHDENRIYGMSYANLNVRFRVEQSSLYVLEIVKK